VDEGGVEPKDIELVMTQVRLLGLGCAVGVGVCGELGGAGGCQGLGCAGVWGCCDVSSLPPLPSSLLSILFDETELLAAQRSGSPLSSF